MTNQRRKGRRRRKEITEPVVGRGQYTISREAPKKSDQVPRWLRPTRTEGRSIRLTALGEGSFIDPESVQLFAQIVHRADDAVRLHAAIEIFEDVASVTVAIVAVTLQGVEDDTFEELGAVLPLGARSRDRRVEHAGGGLVVSSGTEERTAECHFVQDDTHGEKVHSLIEGEAIELFRGEVSGSSTKVSASEIAVEA